MRIGPGGPRMCRRLTAVARDHRQGMRRRAAHDFFGVREHDDRAADLAVLREGLARQALAGRGPEIVLEPIVRVRLPAVEQRRFDARLPGDVRIHLGRHVDAAAARVADDRQHARRLCAAAALDVDDVQRRAGFGRDPDHLVRARHRIAASHVHVRGGARASCGLERVDELRARGFRRIREPEADRHGAAAETALDPSRDVGDLTSPRRSMRRRSARQKITRVLHHRHSRGNVADADAVVEE